MLTEGPIGKTLVKMTIPMSVGIVAMVAFNLTDTLFVGRLGTSELAALSFSFPVILVLTRFALGIGIGSASVISRAIGEGNWKAVQRLTTDGLILAGMIVAIITIAGFLMIDNVFRALGARGEVLVLVGQYMRIWYFGLIFVVFPMVSNNAIRATGDTKTPMKIMLTAVAINVILDPLLIFGLGPFPRMEIRGAAVATVIARAVTFAVSFYVIYRKKRMITFERPSLREIFDSWKRILYIAIPAAATMVIIPVGLGVLTGIVAAYGEKPVASLGVANRIEFFTLAVIMALSSVIAPFVGQNWGAGKFDRLKKGISLSSRFAFVWGLGACALLVLVARPCALIFSKDPEVVSWIVLYLRIVPAAYFMQGIFRLDIGILNVLNRPLQAAALGVMQVFVLTVPLAYLGARFFGVTGVFLALAVAYVISGAVSHPVLWAQVRKVERKRRLA